MKTVPLLLGFAAMACAFQTSGAVTEDANANWPQWRGPLANGVAPGADPPLEWSETKNVKWKVKIPGEGSATPVVWGERVFVLTAIPELQAASAKEADTKPEPLPSAGPGGRRRPGGGFGGGQKPTTKYKFTVMCLDRSSGKILWQKIAREELPHAGHQQNNTFASASPITDGQVVLAYFGSEGLHCYDMEGNLKWQKDFGQMQTKMGFGEGASPTLYGDAVILNWDDETDNDFIVAFDKNTGKQLWKTPRNESTGWSTPLVVEHSGKLQVVVNASGKVRSYDFTSGKELWSCAGQTANAIPSPVADADTVYVTSGFRGSALFAIKLGATGDLAGTDAIRWTYNQNTPYVPSPLLAGDLLYVTKVNSGMLTCLDAKTGKPHFETERLEGVNEIYASPVAAKDRVYVLSRDGKCVVLKKGPKLEVLATNNLDDRTDASIALVGKELFIRGREDLYCISEK